MGLCLFLWSTIIPSFSSTCNSLSLSSESPSMIYAEPSGLYTILPSNFSASLAIEEEDGLLLLLSNKGTAVAQALFVGVLETV